MQIIGRKQEIKELIRLKESKQAEFVAVYGRRRVGKTWLVRSFFHDQFTFYATGIARGSRQEQLQNFYKSICSYSKSNPQQPKDWYETFDLLKNVIKRSRQRRKVVFLDELPWMDTQKSEFLKAVDLFWNSWGCMQKNLLFIVCGSAASWMVKNIIRNKGGLHNRLTCHLHLNPFTLAETKTYLHAQGIRWNNDLIAECYMIMGGIPYYLHLLDRSLSLAQNVDRLFFSPNALLKNEFRNLYESLFKKSEDYVKIISALSKKSSGYTRDDIVNATGLTNGGGLTRRLDELEQCNFIRRYSPIKGKTPIYQLADFYSLFYFQFINKMRHFDRDAWMHLQATPRHSTWLGLSFEKLCFAHVYAIQKALGITGIATKTYPLLTSNAQMDMVIERADKVTTLCEMKYTAQPYVVTKQEAEKLHHRAEELSSFFRAQNQVLITLVSNRLPRQNSYYNSLITSNIILSELFE
ncbi:MAG: ATP-binding protein [Bacteroidales bacterium]|nr:ATP-binding protein [Bacteroidales bacterium]